MMTPQAKSLLDQFDQAWQKGPIPRIQDFLAKLPAPTPTESRRQFLEELIKIDLEYRWRRKPPTDALAWRLEDYLTNYAELGTANDLPLELIGWEYLVRQRFGDRPAFSDYALRFPRHGTALREQLRRIDAELTAEAAPLAPAAHAAASPPELARTETIFPAQAPVPVAPVQSVAELLTALRQSMLLSAAQLEQISRLRFAAPRALARDLLQRNWLTAYQVNQLMQGRGADLVLGPYLLLERLGEGGAGQVFKARHQRLNRLVALKVIRRDLLNDAEAVRRFYREIEAVSRLDHPHIVHALDAGPIGGTHVLAMEFVEGIDLGRLVKQRGRLSVQQACTYIRQAALGLQYAHERGLVHRDLKPSNLFLAKSSGPNKEPVVKLLDMGLARLRRGGGTEAALCPQGETTTLTPVGGVVMMGTPDYLAPEQALDFHGADIRADIYSLGCSLYYLLTGQPPFPGGTVPQKLVRHQRAEPTPIQKLRRDVPPQLDLVLRRMLAKDPADRYPTPADVAAALQEVLDDLGRRRKIFRRQGRRWLLVAAVLLLLVGGLTFFLPRDWSSERGLDLLPVEFSWRHEGPVRAVVYSPDGPVVSVGDDKVIRLWDATDGQPRGLIRAEEQMPGALGIALAPDGKSYVIVGKSDDFVALIRNLTTGQEVSTLRNHQVGNCRQPILSPGARMYAGIYVSGREVRLTNVATKRYFSTNLAHDGRRIHAVAFSPDSWLLATAGDDQTARLWDTNTARQTRVLGGHAAAVTALAFAPDGATLATGSDDQTVKLWHVQDGSLRRTLSGHAGRIQALAFSPDGRTLASAGSDSHVKLWDVGSGRLRAVLTGHVGPVLAVAFAPNGSSLVSGGEDQTVRLWRLEAVR